MVNKKLIAGILIIAGVSGLNAVITGKPVTKIVIGADILFIILAIADYFGTSQTIVDALVYLGVGTTLLTEFPWQGVLNIINAQGQSAPTGSEPKAPVAPPGNVASGGLG